MHNRVRMITASFLVKDLHVWWPEGARHFLDQLIDGDLACNNHGWQWVAGTGTDASPYFRVFNPVTQGKKFDPTATTSAGGSRSWHTSRAARRTSRGPRRRPRARLPRAGGRPRRRARRGAATLRGGSPLSVAPALVILGPVQIWRSLDDVPGDLGPTRSSSATSTASTSVTST